MNRTLNKVSCILIQVNLPKTFWTKAITIITYLVNRSPSIAIDYLTPKEKWCRHFANYAKLRIFGCPMYVHVKQRKLELKASKGIFICYYECVKY